MCINDTAPNDLLVRGIPLGKEVLRTTMVLQNTSKVAFTPVSAPIAAAIHRPPRPTFVQAPSPAPTPSC